MKKIILSTILAVVTLAAAQAQGLRLNGYVNYTFDDSFDSYYSSTSYFNGKIQGGLQWGAGLEFLVNPDYGIELMYYRQDTEAPIRYYRLTEQNRVLDLGINYVMIGGARYLTSANERLQGYGGLMAGMAIFNNKNPEQGEDSGATKFAWGLRLGGNIWATEVIGLKLQTHLMSAVQAFGGGFYFGTGGVGAGVSTYSSILQFSLGGGLVIRIR